LYITGEPMQCRFIFAFATACKLGVHHMMMT